MAKLQNRVKREIKKDFKKNPIGYILAIVFLVLGLAAGGSACYFLTKDDTFNIKGDSIVKLSVGDEYTESGYEATSFGKDISSDITIEGKVDTSTSGVYVIKYKCNHLRFKDVVRIRYVVVEEVTE